MATWPERGESPWDEKLKAYIDEAAASGAPNFFPRTPSGRWLIGWVLGQNTSAAPAPGYVPMQVFREQSWYAFGVNINTAVADATVHAALYADDGTGYPGELVVDAGLIDASTTGVNQVELDEPITLPPGLYWTWARVSSNAIRMPVTSHTGVGLPATLWHSGPLGSNTTTLQGGYASSDTEPPAVAPAGMSTNRYLPIVSMRAE